MLVQLFFCVIQSAQELINTEVAVENCGYWSVVCVFGVWIYPFPVLQADRLLELTRAEAEFKLLHLKTYCTLAYFIAVHSGFYYRLHPILTSSYQYCFSIRKKHGQGPIVQR